MKLSIIVPVYNAEKTLGRCLDSILSQTYEDFEVLLVDDGSTDGSGLTADKIAQGDSRLTVIHKANGGPSAARNCALDRIRGEYVTFADSHDELTPGTLGRIMAIMEQHPEYDILEYPATERPGRKDMHVMNPDSRVYADAIGWLSDHGFGHCWMWNKVFRRQMFDGVRFPEDRRMFEDGIVLGKIISRHPVMATTGEGMYLYHWNGDGLTAKAACGGLVTMLEAQLEVVKMLGIDTREKKWHRLYMDMFTAQLYAYRATGRLMLHSQKVAADMHGGMSGMIKSLMLNTLGLKTACRIFKTLRP